MKEYNILWEHFVRTVSRKLLLQVEHLRAACGQRMNANRWNKVHWNEPWLGPPPTHSDEELNQTWLWIVGWASPSPTPIWQQQSLPSLSAKLLVDSGALLYTYSSVRGTEEEAALVIMTILEKESAYCRYDMLRLLLFFLRLLDLRSLRLDCTFMSFPTKRLMLS